MTEGSFDDGNYLVRVRAQVMTRDDSSGGWVPMGGGGLSNVSVRKRAIPSEDNLKHEYFIYGKRTADQSVVLSCIIKKDFQCNRVMPTFYHWRTGNKKFGLTFQTAADARAFDKGVRQAMDDLFDGSGDPSRTHETSLSNDDVFMTLDLPVDSRSSSGSSTTSGSIPGIPRPSSTTASISGDFSSSSPPFTHPHANHHYLHRIHYIRPARHAGGSTSGNGSGSSGVGTSGGSGSQHGDKGHIEEVWTKDKTKTFYKEQMLFDSDKIEVMPTEPYSYVQFAKDKPSRTEHEYSYPVMDSFRLGKRDSINSLKKQQNIIVTPPPLLPTKCKKKKDRRKESRKQSPLTRIQCRYCQEMYNEEDNRRGSCEYAPDGVLSCINATTCISCAQCMLYHCMSDAEGDFNHHPCSCDNSDNQCRRRWFGLALLSLFVPCLWCYIPLQACHRCGVRCNLCGGKHEAA
ncbi:sprouty-related, EVH1 domain-containing protein 2-like isoform X2 [Limulus polyphemus]|uniref:Sprouty-related, EVH1 domain-containing protein 2-like isoform X2 n=1 Tax=Limulus polyphemus TaxID=6850 RepID=A0ABM1SLQ5_LIMPO|nr:sprouty-related, EVH1 domain-containing protein 2-like isoform X2 [Limulus polyphemus]